MEINKTAWNNHIDVRIQSDFYELESFLKEKSSLPFLNIKQIEYLYSKEEPFVMDEPTYTDNVEKTIDKIVTWNYGLSEPMNGLVQNEISI
ncbi:hypothetical protein JGH11_05715 [Dysgonomonas sp. Marseille-P4677]|uniref:hypothetical protein n=1 Tax=Dysgonomonas sp. Marseille-P4677 TaxID=2364790 RepID=UPI001912BF9E|nr:hypothetical protein [Dysgonomonas sp. Marseille-P4677]MBK5720361.1 hypothetical protein [Dysgonomonas sp. Marseille-P4677]